MQYNGGWILTEITALPISSYSSFVQILPFISSLDDRESGRGLGALGRAEFDSISIPLAFVLPLGPFDLAGVTEFCLLSMIPPEE